MVPSLSIQMIDKYGLEQHIWFLVREATTYFGDASDEIIVGFLGFYICRWQTIPSTAGPLFTKKTPSYGYRDPHYKPKTVGRPSQVYNGDPYTDNTAFSQWIEALNMLPNSPACICPWQLGRGQCIFNHDDFRSTKVRLSTNIIVQAALASLIIGYFTSNPYPTQRRSTISFSERHILSQASSFSWTRSHMKTVLKTVSQISSCLEPKLQTRSDNLNILNYIQRNRLLKESYVYVTNF